MYPLVPHHSSALRWRSSEVYWSRYSRRPPAQVRRSLPLRRGLAFVSSRKARKVVDLLLQLRRQLPNQLFKPFHCAASPGNEVPLAWRMNAAILSGSFLPSVSTPLLTSTPQGCARAMASLTFSGLSPPAMRAGRSRGARRRKSIVPRLTGPARPVVGAFQQKCGGVGVASHPLEVAGRVQVDDLPIGEAQCRAVVRGLPTAQLHVLKADGADNVAHHRGVFIKEKSLRLAGTQSQAAG